MDGQLVQVCRPIGSSWELMVLVGTLRQEVAELRAEVQRLQRENLELRQQAGYWKSRHRDALQRITELEQKVEQLEGEKRQLQADLFGRRTETTSRSDRSNDLDDPQDDSREPQRKRGQQPENPGPKRRDYSHLPVREQFLELPPEQCVCPNCGKPLLRHGDTEDSEQIEIEVSAYRRVIRRRRYQRTCTCDGPNIVTAPPAPKLIPKGRYGVSVWVEVLLDKYFSYRPTERLLASWRLLDLDLAPGTVTDGLQRLEVLLRPIYEALQGAESARAICIKPMRRGGRCSSSWRARRDTAGGCGSYWAATRSSSCWMPAAVTRFPKTTFGPSRVECWWSIAIRPTRR